MKKRVAAIVLWAVGLALLVAACIEAARHADAIKAAWGAMADAPAWLIACVVLGPLVNLLLTGAAFCVLNRHYAKVGLGENIVLITSANLLNYLPLRPGMLGRVAFHRKVHGIRVTDSAKVLAGSMIGSSVGVAGLVVAAAAVVLFGDGRVGLLVGASICLGLFAAGQTMRARDKPSWRLLTASGIKFLDSAVWAGRYAAVFALVGAPINVGAAIALALVGQITMLVPLFGNGLGLREWSIALVAPVLAIGAMDGSVVDPTALAADLLNRGVEVLVALPAGVAATLLAGVWLRRAIARGKAASPDLDDQPYEPHEPDASAPVP